MNENKKFYNCLLGTVPVLKETQRTHYEFQNDYSIEKSTLNIPYVSAIREFLKKEGSANKKMLFLITDNKRTAIKVTACLRAMRQSNEAENLNMEDTSEESDMAEEADDDEYMQEFNDFEESFLSDALSDIKKEINDEEREHTETEGCEVIDFTQQYKVPQGMPINYIKALEGIPANLTLLFTGLDDGKDLEEKMECIELAAASLKCIMITPYQSKEPWVLSAQIRNDAEIIFLETPDNSYYEKIAAELMRRTGYQLADEPHGTGLRGIVNMIYARMGKEMDENVIAWFFDKAAEKATTDPNRGKVLKLEDFPIWDSKEPFAMERLEKLPSLDGMKEMAIEFQAIFAEQMRNPKLKKLHNNMIFYGNPGTGKTTCAEIMAQILLENGVSNGTFVSCSRKDLIGKYVGHTAAMVAEKFEKARHGVLFVDEAGFFLNEYSDGFVHEAIKEFVRFMEQYQDVTIIFAMYKSEVQDFLNLDAGLTSRISRMVYFPDYSMEELWKIAQYMIEKNGYHIRQPFGISAIRRYLMEAPEKENFGNARTVRKLVESIIIAASIRHMKEKEDGIEDDDPFGIKVQDARAGIEKLKNEPETENQKRTIGFVPENILNYTAPASNA